MINKEKKKKTQKIKKPNPVIYYPALLLVQLYFKFKLKTTFDLSGLKGIKGPALVVCPHVSNIDFLLVGLALKPQRPTFVVSQHFMVNPKTRWILKAMHVIPKKMFCPDVKTILSIMRAKEAGNIIVLFPEGRLTCCGHSLHVTEGSAELVKKLGLDVYTVTENGAYKTLPKWGKEGFRPGRIHVDTGKLFNGGDLKNLSVDEINAALEATVLHDEDRLFTDVEYKCDRPALGLDAILYKCPECLSEFKMTTDDRFIRCECGFEAELDTKYRLHGGPFQYINDWYFWQKDMLDINIPLESQTILAAVDAEGNMDRHAGEGYITMDKEKITYKGTCFGENLEFTEPTSVIKGFPASAGNHFDIYSKKILYNMHPTPDPRQSIKWMLFLDKVTEEAQVTQSAKEVEDAEGSNH